MPDPRGDPDRIVSQAPISRAEKVTNRAQPSQVSPASKLKTAKTLFLTHVEFKIAASIYVKQVLKGAEIQTVNSWQEMVGLLQQYEKIDQLVLWFHGAPGTLIIGSEAKSLSQLNSLFGERKPKVREINLEACHVAEGAEELIPFARLFNASQVTAWNYSHVVNIVGFKIPEDVDIQMLEKNYARYKGYFLPSTPTPNELAKRPGTYSLFVEWFQVDLIKRELPPPPNPGQLDDRGMTYKPRSAAKERRITSDKVKKLQDEYEKTPTEVLEHVTIEISDK